MNECDLHNANEMDDAQQELKETEPTEKLQHNIEQEIHKSPVIKTHPSNESENIILEDKGGQENAQKDDEFKEDNNIQKKVSAIIDSDSEDEILFVAKPKRKKAIYDNSEDEESDSNQNESENHLDNKKNTKTDFDGDSNVISNIANDNNNEERSRFKALIDSDSEIEEEEEDGKHSTPIRSKKMSKRKDGKDSKSNMRKVSLRASKEEAMKQIHNETQRLIRETEVSVPYHKPKQQSLQAFLNRKKIVIELPKAPTMATKLKLSSDIVDEVLKEKEKEAEIFYKSSDSEEETIEDHSSDKENLDCQQQLKNPSRKLFTDDNLPASDNKEQGITNEVQETLTELKDSEDNEAIADSEAKNANDSMTVEVHCDFNDADNIDEESKNEGVKTSETSENVVVNDTSLSKYTAEMLENENKAESANDDSEKCNKETPNESPDCSGPKINSDYAKLVKESLGLNASEADEYNEYGLPPPTFDDSPNINEMKSLSKLKCFKPKLRGTPGTMIDFSDENKPRKNGINSLIDRFVNKHSKVSECKKDTSNVTATRIIESPNGISVVKETLPYKAAALPNEDPKLKKPGAKLVRLREELKHKMALKRDKEWKQREQEMKEQEIEWDESMTEEEHLSDPPSPSIKPDESDEEDELEEDDLCMKSERKKKKKNAYIDDEADVSDDEINDSDEIEDEEEEEDELSEHSEDEADNNEESSKCKTFKRIFEPLEDDSRSSNTELIENILDKERKASICLTTGSDIFNTSANENEQDSDNESDIQASQEHVESDLKCETPQIKSNRFDFVSPVTQLTALNAHVESEGEESPEIEKQFPILMRFTQSQDFVDQNKPLDEESKQEKVNFHLSCESNVTESQLLDLCSGKFTSQANDPQFSVDILQSVETSSEKDLSSSKTNVNDEKQQSEKDTAAWNRLRVVSSDEDDLMEDNVKKRAKKRVKKLDLSDDENEQSSAESDDEEKLDEDEEKYIDYDSEENEVVVSSKNMKQYASKFLEEEAELSESDCDVSADENEEDLDKLEFEEVDDDEIDESKVKKQLERLHVKQILDEDQKEVRMLKELLFEEGDLYSESARERKFKWRNIDKQENGDDVPLSEDKDGWMDLSDDEEQAKWRKLKHEREKFLAEKLGNIDAEIEEDLNKSEIFNLGMKILKKRRINESNKQETLLESLDSKVELRIPHTVAEMLNNTKLEGNSRMLNSVLQKRSFLAKGEESLARLATLARQKETALPSLNGKKFVFAHIDDSSEEKESAPVIKIQPKALKVKRNR